MSDLPVSNVSSVDRHLKRAKISIFMDVENQPLRLSHGYMSFQKALKSIQKEGERWNEKDFHNILNALEFAARRHRRQTRKDKEQTPYIVHPLSVAVQLISVGDVRDVDVIIASLLHDIIEDTSTNYLEIKRLFGQCVADFVQEVSDDKSLSKEERKKAQILTAPQKSPQATAIKLADKWDNLSDLLTHPIDWPEERIYAYFIWAKQVVEALPRSNPHLLKAVQSVISKYFGDRSLS